jgi:hypothetical protein
MEVYNGVEALLSNTRTSFGKKIASEMDWTVSGSSEETVCRHFGVRAEGRF